MSVLLRIKLAAGVSVAVGFLLAGATANAAIAPKCRTSFNAAERNYTPIPKRPVGNQVAWVCTVDSTNVTCEVRTSGGIGTDCVCCWKDTGCLRGTVTDRS